MAPSHGPRRVGQTMELIKAIINDTDDDFDLPDDPPLPSADPSAEAPKPAPSDESDEDPEAAPTR